MYTQSPEQEYQELKHKMLEQISSTFPIKDRGGKYELRVDNLRVQDHSLGVDDIKGQYAAKVSGRSYGAPILGDVKVIDATTGKVVNEQSGMRVATVPKMTRNYSFIIAGTEKQFANQWRLKPGAYVKETEKPGEFEAQFQLSKGPAFDVRLDPESAELFMAIRGRKVPLYSVLHASGVSDDQLEKSWGKEALEANKKAAKMVDKHVASLYEVWKKKPLPQNVPIKDTILGLLNETAMSPDVTQITLGKKFEAATPDALLAASAKLINVSAGKVRPDPIDALHFKELWTAKDHIIDRVALAKPEIERRVQNVLSNPKKHKSLRDIMMPDLINKPVNHLFITDLARDPNQTNPVDILSNRSTVTITGPGGIQNENAITYSNKAIDPSHMGYLDPVHTPESDPGVNLHLAAGVYAKDRKPLTLMWNVKKSKLEEVSPDIASKSNVAFPDQYKLVGKRMVPTSKKVKINDSNGEIREVSPTDVDYVLPLPSQLFSIGTNLVPFAQNNSAGRATMSARHMEQAISIVGREPPKVQVAADDPKNSFEKELGKFAAHHSPVDGKVVSVSNDYITVQSPNGERHKVSLYHNYPLNNPKAFYNSTPVVKEGDKVKKGQLLADTNFTKDGVLSIGTNLRVAYLANGLNHEDGIVISESAQKKLSSEHMYKPSLYKMEGMEVGNSPAHHNFTKYTSEQFKKLDESGIIKPGTKVMPGDPLVLAIRHNTNANSVDFKSLARLTTKNRKIASDASLVWDGDTPGEVVAVFKKGNEYTVHVRATEPMVVGNKLSTRHAAKGIVTQILPDADMPRDANGKPVEMLINPLSVVGRMNIGQVLETAAGKIAEKTGKPYMIRNFAPGTDYLKKVQSELQKHGLKDTETLYDPKTGRKLGDVLVGPQYAFQLVHQIDKKTSVRGGHAYIKNIIPQVAYDNDGIPRGGGETGAQSLGGLGIYAALASGLHRNLSEMQTLKSDRAQAEVLWNSLAQGKLMPTPQVPAVYNKFKALMEGMGLNLQKAGHNLRLVPATDKAILQRSRGALEHPELAVVGKNLAPDKGGLFDIDKTGGLNGTHYAHIPLVEPMPNPLFQKPIEALLGLKKGELVDVLAGKKSLPNTKAVSGAAVVEALRAIDVNKELEKARKALDDPKLTGTELNKAHQKYQFLKKLQEENLRPDEAYTLRNVPVIPPIYRPIGEMPGGALRIDPLNQLYRRIGQQNSSIRDAEKAGWPREANLEARVKLFQELQNMFGVVAKNKRALDIDFRGKDVKDKSKTLAGILHLIGGDRPKDGFFQQKMIEKRQDFSARATIVADPALSVDEVGVPKKVAFELYRPFIAKELTRMGMPGVEAHKQIAERTAVAEKALRDLAAQRPVILKRDPVLHAYGLVGQKVRLTNSPAITVNPLILPPIGGDIDGDTVALFLPISDHAVQEVRKIMPSERTLSAASGDVLSAPTNEAALSIYRTSLVRGEKNLKFADIAAAEAAFRTNKINLDDAVHIGGVKTTLGRARVAAVVPSHFKKQVLEDLSSPVDRKKVNEILKYVIKNDPKGYEEVATGLSRVGFQMAYDSGHTVTLKDVEPLRKERDKIIAATQKRVDKMTSQDAKNQAWIEATTKLHDTYNKHFMDNKNRPSNVWDMLKSGIKAKKEQFQGAVIAPMLVEDWRGNPSSTPVKKSFAEGIDTASYWVHAQGARRGVLQKVESVQEPGYLTKLLIGANIDTNVTAKDCGTHTGISMPIGHKDVVDRHLATSVQAGNTTYKAGTIVTPDIQQALSRAKVSSVVVRSPLKCRMPSGVCSVCMGLHPNGRHYEDGAAVGVIAAQSLGERATQLMLRKTHGAGIMSHASNVTDEFQVVNDILKMAKPSPENAAVATKDGKVTQIEKLRQGGYRIYTTAQKKPYFSRNEPVVKAGGDFKRGELLTKGDPNPHDLLKAQGLEGVQRYMVDRLGDIYGREGIKQRHVELAVRSASGLMRVKDPGGASNLVPGDYVMKPTLDYINEKTPNKVKAEPVLKSIMITPWMRSKDWLGLLQTSNISKHIINAATTPMRSDIHGQHPIPALAYAAEFGQHTVNGSKVY